MRVVPVEPPRAFRVGREGAIQLFDCARIELAPDEQVTFVTPAGGEYDVARKSWGYYATPSLNARLPRFGLRPALVRGPDNKYFVLLVERGRESEFEHYLRDEGLAVVRWLERDEQLSALERDDGPAPSGAWPRCICGADRFEPAFHYDAPPPGEIRFKFSSGVYSRDVLRCATCGHFVSLHSMDTSGMYSQEYVDSTYGANGIRKAFDRITALDPAKSDNVGRVRRVLEFGNANLGAEGRTPPPHVLDVGSGLCVFLHRVKAAGWRCTALDPDPRAVTHARDLVGVDAVCGDFLDPAVRAGLGRYEAVTFNKVLEHVLDPIAMLALAAPLVAPGGFVYVELPDGEAAAAEGPGREEFFIDHHHVFSAASMAILAMRAGFDVRAVERLREPSTKFTLRAFLVPRARGAITG